MIARNPLPLLLLCAALPLLSCRKTELPKVESMDILYVVEVSQDVLQVADVQIHYLDAAGKVQTEPLTRTAWKKRLPSPTYRSLTAVWAKMTPKANLNQRSYSLAVNPAAGLLAHLDDGSSHVDGYGLMDEEIIVSRDSVAHWCSISPTLALMIGDTGYARIGGYDFGGNNKERTQFYRMVKWLSATFGLD